MRRVQACQPGWWRRVSPALFYMGDALRNIGLVSGVTAFSRVLGLVRDMAISAVFGAGALASAYVTAFALPNLFRRLLGEGALTAALIPTLQEQSRGPEGEPAIWRLVSEVASWTLLLTGVICAMGMSTLAAHVWWAPSLASAGLDGATVARWAEAARLGVILFPYVVMVCLAAVVSAALQLRGRFLEPALNPVWLNLSIIGLLMAGVAMTSPGDLAARMPWLCAGVLLGGAAQLIVPARALWQLGWRPRWSLRLSPGVRQIAALMLPTLFGTAIYLINTTLSRLLAISLDDRAATLLNLSTRLMELPIGVFAMAVATVVFPLISRHAAEGRLDLLADEYRRGMRLVLLVNVPAAVGLAVLAEPVTRVLFERGEFTANDTRAMTPVLAVSVLALPCLAYVSLALRAFYARKDTRTPVVAAAWSLAVNVVGGLVLMRWLGAPGLALASTLGVVAQSIWLQSRLGRVHEGLRLSCLLPHLLRVAAAAVAMGAAVRATDLAWRARVEPSIWTDAAGLALAVGVGVAVFALAAWLARVEGRDEIVALIRRKLARSRRTSA